MGQSSNWGILGHRDTLIMMTLACAEGNEKGDIGVTVGILRHRENPKVSS